MTRNTVNTKHYWDFPEFTHQDMDLFLAYQRVKKHRINKASDLKAGLVVNVRDTVMLDNCLVEVLMLKGYAMKTTGSLKSMRFHNVQTCRNKPSRFSVDVNSLWHPGKNGIFKSKKDKKGAHGGVYVSSLIRDWMTLHYNTEVMQFIRMLQKADRFQQHCIIKNEAYTKDNYDSWVLEVESDRDFDESIRLISDSFHED